MVVYTAFYIPRFIYRVLEPPPPTGSHRVATDGSAKRVASPRHRRAGKTPIMIIIVYYYY